MDCPCKDQLRWGECVWGACEDSVGSWDEQVGSPPQPPALWAVLLGLALPEQSLRVTRRGERGVMFGKV